MSVKVHLIAAARPNFMKVAPLYHALKATDWATPVLVHTGQHYDVNMSGWFFRDLGQAPQVRGNFMGRNDALVPGSQNVIGAQGVAGRIYAFGQNNRVCPEKAPLAGFGTQLFGNRGDTAGGLDTNCQNDQIEMKGLPGAAFRIFANDAQFIRHEV